MHVAIIMDGNRRWASANYMSQIRGHLKGAHNLEKIVEACNTLGITCLTLYAFSTENWKRDTAEVHSLMKIFERYARKQIKNAHKSGVKVRILGDVAQLPVKTRDALSALESASTQGDKLLLQLAVNYGGRSDIVRAVNRWRQEHPCSTDIDEETLSTYLDTCHIPDPDIMIRTGGEQRLSNFLLWQLSYTELFFTPTFWPNFSVEELRNILQKFCQRHRHFGGMPQKNFSLSDTNLNAHSIATA